MKAIQSFWSKPFLKGGIRKSNERNIGGFLSRKLFFMSCALSVLKLREHFDEVELVTDTVGKEILIDELKLPYTNCINVLDDLNKYDERLWAIGKIYAYQLQKEPFVHVDADAFLWNKLPDRLLNAPLICQNIEALKDNQVDEYAEFINKLDFVPEDLNTFFVNRKYAFNKMANAGIIGGNDVSFFQKYTTAAFEFINKNLSALETMEGIGFFNCIFEQQLYTCMAKNTDTKVEELLDFPISRSFGELVQFNLLSQKRNFIHLIAGYKSSAPYLEQMIIELKYQYPEYYKRINKISNEITL